MHRPGAPIPPPPPNNPGQATDPIIHRQDTNTGPKTTQRPRSPPTPPRPAHTITWTAKHMDNRIVQRHQSAPTGTQHQGRIPRSQAATSHLLLHGGSHTTSRTHRSPTATQARKMVTQQTWTQLSPCRPTHHSRNRYKNRSLRSLLPPSRNSLKPPYKKPNALPAKNIKRNSHK